MRQKILIWLRNFFGFSRSEANGFILLLLLMVIVLSAPFISKQFFLEFQQTMQTPSDKDKLETLLKELEKNSHFEKPKIETEKPKFKSFDINKANVNQLEESGLPQFLAERIVKYREKVKPFDSKAELLKIYGIDSTFYKEIFPYITISKIKKDNPSKIEKNKNQITKDFKVEKEKKSASSKSKSFDINKADADQLQKIHGIGPAYSKRIIEYRALIGGFNSLKQLKEVYGLKQENLDSIKNYVFIEEDFQPKKQKVNSVNADSLISHPYISYKEANLIVNYRKQHGKYESSKDLYKVKVLDSAWIDKIKPYFSFE